jgi:hypothetical protein
VNKSVDREGMKVTVMEVSQLLGICKGIIDFEDDMREGTVEP